MIYILIMISMGSNAAHTQEFKTLEACAFAANQVQAMTEGQTIAFCTAKGGKHFPTGR